MITKRIPSLVLLSLGMLTHALGQGSLTPSAAPAPTMRSLDQIEPRVPISASTIIGAAGSYYLTKNISVTSGNAFLINASNVTLDLNGFTISSSESPANANNCGILLNANLSNITILNGNIVGNITYNGTSYSGTGFGCGISYGGGAPSNVRVRGVNVSGVSNNAINFGIGSSTTVEWCTVNIAGAYGIVAGSVSDSEAYGTANSAILAQNALNCTGSSNGNDGVQATTAQNCVGTSSGAGHGIAANQATNCYGTNTGSGTGDGVHADNAINCQGSASGGGYGIHVTYVAENCYGTVTSGIGIRAEDAVLNSIGNGTSYGIFTPGVATNCYGSGGSTGVSCTIANSCYGSGTSYGLSASYAAFASSGIGGSYGISSDIAAFCVGRVVQLRFPLRITCLAVPKSAAFSRATNTSAARDLLPTHKARVSLALD